MYLITKNLVNHIWHSKGTISEMLEKNDIQYKDDKKILL